MTMRLEDLPSWQRKRAIALSNWHDGLLENEKVEAKQARDAARAKSKARQHGRAGLAERIITGIFIEGKTVEEVATDLGWTPRNLRLRAAAYGIPLASRAGHRRAPSFWLTEETFSALSGVAADASASLPETIEKLCRFHGEHEGLTARRALRLPAKAPVPEPETEAA